MTVTFINSFILFFVTIDTIGNLPFFLSLTEGAKIKKRNQIALKSIIIFNCRNVLFHDAARPNPSKILLIEIIGKIKDLARGVS